MNGAATCIAARRMIGPASDRSSRTRPLRRATGNRITQASAVRTKTIIGGENTSSSATLMNR